MKEYPRTLEAVERAELGVWPIVDALLAEIEMTTTGRRVKAGEYERVSRFLAESGYKGYSPARLADYGEIGQWAAGTGTTTFQTYPFELVRQVKRMAKGDHEQALLLLKAAEQKRAEAGAKKLTPSYRDFRLPQAATVPQTEEEAEKIVDAMIEKAPMRIRVHLEDELRLARAGRKRLTPAERKERAAVAGEMTDTIQRGLDQGLGTTGVVLALEQVAEDLAEFTAGVPAESLRKIRDAYDRVGQELEILEAREGVLR